jgi:hypothetical protein
MPRPGPPTACDFAWQLKDGKMKSKLADIESRLKTAAAEAKPDLMALRQAQADLMALSEELSLSKEARFQQLANEKAGIESGISKKTWTGEMEAELRGIELPDQPEMYGWRMDPGGPQPYRLKG